MHSSADSAHFCPASWEGDREGMSDNRVEDDDEDEDDDEVD